MRIALLGSRGYIGSEFARQLKGRNVDFVPIYFGEYDLCRPETLVAKLRLSGADALVNCAGYTGKPNVDACERDKANCMAGNAVLPGTIAEACQALSIPWGHVSSGCIYTGSKPDSSGFTEDDQPNFSFRQNNCSFYSGTKALGEEVISDAQGCYIWRLRIPFSHIDSPRNYLSKIMRYDRLLDAENSLSDLHELVRACIDCITRSLPFGTYNLTNPGSITTREIVDMIITARVAKREFSFFDSESEFMQNAAITPRSNCILDCKKALNAGLKLTEVRSAVSQALDNWQNEPESHTPAS